MRDDGGTAALGDLLMRLARTQRRRWADALAPWDLSPPQARALREGCAGGGGRLSDPAEGLRIAPRSATEGAEGLQQRGRVERSADPADRRAVLLRPTDEGRRVQREVAAARAADSAELFGRLSAEDRRTLARILRALAD